MAEKFVDKKVDTLSYQEVLLKGFWRDIRARMGKGCNDLLDFTDVFEKLKALPYTQLGLVRVPLNQIVGSSGRSHDFDLGFFPHSNVDRRRWISVADARQEDKRLPPVSLYKIGEAYFVEDGNHRVSVARMNQEEYIDAYVTEFDVSSLEPAPSCSRLGYKLA